MPLRRAHAKTRGKTVEKLCGKSDLREEHKRLPASAHGFSDRFEIELGLARSGDTVKQRNAVTASSNTGAQCICRDALRGRKVRAGKIRIGHPCNRLRRQRQGFQSAFFDEAVNDPGRDPRGLRNLALRAGNTVSEQSEHALPCGCQPLWWRPDKSHTDMLARRTEMLAHAQRHAQNHSTRRKRVIGNPVYEAPQLGLERRQIELFLYILEAVVKSRVYCNLIVPYDACCCADPERDADDIAGAQLQIARHAVRIGLVQCDRHEHIHTAHRAERCGRGGSLAHRRSHALRSGLVKKN